MTDVFLAVAWPADEAFGDSITARPVGLFTLVVCLVVFLAAADLRAVAVVPDAVLLEAADGFLAVLLTDPALRAGAPGVCFRPAVAAVGVAVDLRPAAVVPVALRATVFAVDLRVAGADGRAVFFAAEPVGPVLRTALLAAVEVFALPERLDFLVAMHLSRRNVPQTTAACLDTTCGMQNR